MILETSDGMKLFYEALGERSHSPVLLLHGLGVDHQMWRPQISRYPSEGLFVIVPDVRGHGKSSIPPKFSIKDCARDMLELLEGVGVEKTNVVGVSMGGLIAQQLVCDYPEKVDRLIIVDSFSGVSSGVERFNAWLASFLLAVLPTGFQTKLLVTTYRKMGKVEVGEYFKTQLARFDSHKLRHMRKAVNGFNIVERLGEIRAPTLVLVGDGFGKVAIGMARKTAEAIGVSQFKELEGGGDPSNLLVPEVFDQEVLSFVK